MASNSGGRHSRTLRWLAAILIAAVALVEAAAAQKKNPYRNYTEEKFVENMQAAGRNFDAVTNLIGDGDYESAKAQLTRAREQLAITITFWRDRQRDDAIKMLREALNGMDGLDAVLSASPVDAAAVKAASSRVNAACNACHAVYREQDPVTKAYRLKPGSAQ
jgi:cytochrome c556